MNSSVYYSHIRVNGQFFTPDQTAMAPSIVPFTNQTVVMWDQTANHLHWVVDNRQTLVVYQGPHPPNDGKLHQYNFAVVPNTYEFNYDARTNFALPSGFTIATFLSQYTENIG